MLRNGVSVLGVGQTKYESSRPEVSTPELVFEAVSRAFADANCGPNDVDAVIFASAPDSFEGVHEPDHWCAEACAMPGKPAMRIHTGGATGGSGAFAGIWLIAAEQYERVLVVGLQRTLEAEDAQQLFTTCFDPIYEKDIQLNVLVTQAMQCSRLRAKFGLTEDHMAWVGAKNFTNGLRNPYTHLKLEVTPEDVKQSRMLVTPLRLLHTCPRSDGACAVVLGSKAAGKRASHAAWVHGLGSADDVYRMGDRMHTEDSDFAHPRALSWAATRAYREAGISDPRSEIDAIEIYAPFTHLEVASYESMGLAPRGRGWTLVEEEATSASGDIPVCPSGGCQTSNPIGATGLIRFAEAAMQVTGRAGDHQVEGAETAVATATGGVNQFFTVAVLRKGRTSP